MFWNLSASLTGILSKKQMAVETLNNSNVILFLHLNFAKILMRNSDRILATGRWFRLIQIRFFNNKIGWSYHYIHNYDITLPLQISFIFWGSSASGLKTFSLMDTYMFSVQNCFISSNFWWVLLKITTDALG